MRDSHEVIFVFVVSSQSRTNCAIQAECYISRGYRDHSPTDRSAGKYRLDPTQVFSFIGKLVRHASEEQHKELLTGCGVAKSTPQKYP